MMKGKKGNRVARNPFLYSSQRQGRFGHVPVLQRDADVKFPCRTLSRFPG